MVKADAFYKMDSIENFGERIRPCGFLHLPLELREQIYGYLVNQDGRRPAVVVSVETYDGIWRYTREPEVPLHTAILRVNKQLYAEAVPILYAACAFSPVADERTISEFFGRLSEHARANILRLELKPRRSAGRSVPGQHPNISQIQVAPLWGPVCGTVAALLPALREIGIHLIPFNRFELKAGRDLSWIFSPLSDLRGVRKTLCFGMDTGVDAETSNMLVERWNTLMGDADREMEEYTKGMVRAREYQNGWPNSHWRTKRIRARMGTSPPNTQFSKGPEGA